MKPDADTSDKRFVVLFHLVPQEFVLSDATPMHRRRDHWDLMLEWEGELLTWALESDPFQPQKRSANLLATELAPHRIDYLNFEGPISGNRGFVKRIMAGTYQLLPPLAEGQPIRDNSPVIGSGSILEYANQGSFRLDLRVDGQRWEIEFRRRKGSQTTQLALWDLVVIASKC